MRYSVGLSLKSLSGQPGQFAFCGGQRLTRAFRGDFVGKFTCRALGSTFVTNLDKPAIGRAVRSAPVMPSTQATEEFHLLYSPLVVLVLICKGRFAAIAQARLPGVALA